MKRKLRYPETGSERSDQTNRRVTGNAAERARPKINDIPSTDQPKSMTKDDLLGLLWTYGVPEVFHLNHGNVVVLKFTGIDHSFVIGRADPVFGWLDRLIRNGGKPVEVPS